MFDGEVVEAGDAAFARSPPVPNSLRACDCISGEKKKKRQSTVLSVINHTGPLPHTHAACQQRGVGEIRGNESNETYRRRWVPYLDAVAIVDDDLSVPVCVFLAAEEKKKKKCRSSTNETVKSQDFIVSVIPRADAWRYNVQHEPGLSYSARRRANRWRPRRSFARTHGILCRRPSLLCAAFSVGRALLSEENK